MNTIDTIANSVPEGLERVMNKHGHYDYIERDDPQSMPVCPNCRACVRTNIGSGNLCDNCNHEIETMARHDYEEGVLR